MTPLLGLKIALLLALLEIVNLTYHVAEGRADTESIVTKEELNMQMQLLNRPHHAAWGDIYDCIEFYKQPAFDHPLLKDHKFEIKEELISTNWVKTSTNQVDECPKGTVPIRRPTKEDIRTNKLSSNFTGNQYRAGVSYQTKPGETVHGASGMFNVWNPQVYEDQLSSAEISLQAGSEDQMNIIRFGWTVNPQLYGDHLTRLFAYWTSDSGKKTGCYNTLCPGFVQVHPKYTPDSHFVNTSVTGGAQVILDAQITLDTAEGKWWLTAQRNIRIGYWPEVLFPAFAPGVTSVFWGGSVMSGIDGISPPMCNGNPIDDYLGNAGFVQSIQYVDMNNNYLKPEKIESTIDCLEHYNATYVPEHSNVHFGGTGGANCR